MNVFSLLAKDLNFLGETEYTQIKFERIDLNEEGAECLYLKAKG